MLLCHILWVIHLVTKWLTVPPVGLWPSPKPKRWPCTLVKRYFRLFYNRDWAIPITLSRQNLEISWKRHMFPGDAHSPFAPISYRWTLTCMEVTAIVMKGQKDKDRQRSWPVLPLQACTVASLLCPSWLMCWELNSVTERCWGDTPQSSWTKG